VTSASLLLALALAAQAGGAGDGMRVAVLPLGGSAPEAVKLELEGLVRAELSRLLNGAEVLDGDATREELAAAQMMGLNCEPDDTPCVARTAILMQVARVLTGTIELAGDSAKVVLYLVEASTGVRLNEIEQLVPTSGPARLSIARDVVTLLVAPEQILGSLRLIVQPAGALVVLDGEPVGTAPMSAPLTGIRAGHHAVRVELDGYVSSSEQVEVTAGREAMIDIALVKTGVGGANPPDENLALSDDAPGNVGSGGGFGVPVLIAGGVAAALGGGVTLGAAGAALAIDAILWNTDIGDHNQRNQMLTAEAVLAVAALVAGSVLAVGVAATGVGGVILLIE
jgi:hypothetical protein